MKGLIYKEACLFFRSLEKKSLFIIAVVMLFLYYQIGVYAGAVVSVMLSMFLGMQTLAGVYNDEKVNWNEYQLTMPVSNYSIVASRYIFMLLVLLISAAGSVLINLLTSVMYNNWDSYLWGGSMAASLLLPLLWLVISIPLAYWFGYHTARLMVFLAIIPMVYIMNSFMDGVEVIALPDARILFFLLICTVAVLLCVISYFISVAGYSRKK